MLTGEGGGGGRGAESYDREKGWPSSLNHSILSAGHGIRDITKLARPIRKKSYVSTDPAIPAGRKKNLFAGCEEDEFIVLGHPLQELHKVGPSPHKHLTQEVGKFLGVAQCCGSGMFIPDPGSASKDLSILNQSNVF